MLSALFLNFYFVTLHLSCQLKNVAHQPVLGKKKKIKLLAIVVADLQITLKGTQSEA